MLFRLLNQVDIVPIRRNVDFEELMAGDRLSAFEEADILRIGGGIILVGRLQKFSIDREVFEFHTIYDMRRFWIIAPRIDAAIHFDRGVNSSIHHFDIGELHILDRPQSRDFMLIAPSRRIADGRRGRFLSTIRRRMNHHPLWRHATTS